MGSALLWVTLYLFLGKVLDKKCNYLAIVVLCFTRSCFDILVVSWEFHVKLKLSGVKGKFEKKYIH